MYDLKENIAKQAFQGYRLRREMGSRWSRTTGHVKLMGIVFIFECIDLQTSTQ